MTYRTSPARNLIACAPASLLAACQPHRVTHCDAPGVAVACPDLPPAEFVLRDSGIWDWTTCSVDDAVLMLGACATHVIGVLAEVTPPRSTHRATDAVLCFLHTAQAAVDAHGAQDEANMLRLDGHIKAVREWAYTSLGKALTRRVAQAFHREQAQAAVG